MEDVARAVGATSTDVFLIGGKECRPRALTIRELTELERECVKQYRRAYLQVYIDNADIIPKGHELLEKKIEEAARLDVSSLPSKYAYDSELKITDELEAWLKANITDYESNFKKVGQKDKKDKEATKEQVIQNVTVVALSDGLLSEAEYAAMTGESPKKAKIPYVSWWITGSFDGMLSMIWQSFRKDGITKDELLEAIGQDTNTLVKISRAIEHLSAPKSAVGNE